MNRNELFAEIVRIESMIESGEAKGKLTALKAAHRKLCSQYARASAKARAASS